MSFLNSSVVLVGFCVIIASPYLEGYLVPESGLYGTNHYEGGGASYLTLSCHKISILGFYMLIEAKGYG